jgi:hypothetical protein
MAAHEDLIGRSIMLDWGSPFISRSLLVALAATTALACTKPDASPGVTKPVDDGKTEPEAEAPFANPGGMWMPSQLSDEAHVKNLQKLGLAFDPLALSKPTEFPLGAVISLGGCSASFVSEHGLIVTNHHCVTGALNYNSKAGNNLHDTGFLAKNRGEELWAGPTQKIWVTRAFTDVTAQVLGGLEAITDPQARWDEVGKRRQELASKCEEGKADTRCIVASYFEGAQFFQIEQLELRDIRLVHAPHAGVSVYGGEIDNWRWPRHTGDYSFYRAYVGPDGLPADYAPTNVPYQPKYHLEIATSDLDEGDLVLVAGYPGKTSRLKTSAEVRDAVDWYYPRRIARLEQYIATLERTTAGNEALQIKAEPTLRSLNNGLTNAKGQLEGLSKRLAADKAAQEQELRDWIAADADRKQRYGTVLDELATLDAEQKPFQEHDATLDELANASALFARAREIVGVAKKRADGKAPTDKEIEKYEQALAVAQTRYAKEIDRAALRLHLVRAAALPAEQQPELLRILVGGEGPIDEAAIDKALDKLYAKTKLGDSKKVLDLYEKATLAQLEKSKDPMIVAALAARTSAETVSTRQSIVAGKMALLRPRYIAALREFAASQGKTLAPDANSTLRVTYGTVRGYAPRPDAPVYVPFTTATEMLAKHTGEEPFNLPEGVRNGIAAKNFGAYADPEFGELTIDFLTDLDITGGNSGSATINARGELVGLVFDGNYEAMASDWVFMPELTRAIHVDIRSVLWVMDAIDGADWLLEEMGVTPTL